MTEEEFATLLESIENDSYKDTYKNNDVECLNTMLDYWGKAFNYSDELYNKLLAYNNVKLKQYKENYQTAEGSAKNKIIFMLLARSLTTYLGIVTLIKNGFGELAEASCRTLLELKVTIVFILHNPEDVAEEYYKQAFDSKKKNYSWVKKSKAFKNKKGHVTYARLKDYVFNEIIPNEKNFIFDDFYNSSNAKVHSDPKATVKRSCIPSQYYDKTLISGRSVFGIAVAADYSASILARLFAFIFLYDDLCLIKPNNSDKSIFFNQVAPIIINLRKNYVELHNKKFPQDAITLRS